MISILTFSSRVNFSADDILKFFQENRLTFHANGLQCLLEDEKTIINLSCAEVAQRV